MPGVAGESVKNAGPAGQIQDFLPVRGKTGLMDKTLTALVSKHHVGLWVFYWVCMGGGVNTQTYFTVQRGAF
jgi:hypothetical protein